MYCSQATRIGTGTLSRVEGKSRQSPVRTRLSNRNSCHYESTAATPRRLHGLASRPRSRQAIDTAPPVQMSEIAGAWPHSTAETSQVHISTSRSIVGERTANQPLPVRNCAKLRKGLERISWSLESEKILKGAPPSSRSRSKHFLTPRSPGLYQQTVFLVVVVVVVSCERVLRGQRSPPTLSGRLHESLTPGMAIILQKSESGSLLEKPYQSQRRSVVDIDGGRDKFALPPHPEMLCRKSPQDRKI